MFFLITFYHISEDIKHYDLITYRDQTEIEILKGKGDELYKKQEYDEALKYYEMALDIDPKDVHALNGKGNILYEKIESGGSYWEAIFAFQDVLDIDPNHVNALLKKGNIWYEQEDYDQALEYYDKLLSIEPTNLNGLINNANALQYLKRYDDAIKQYDKILEIDTENKDALHNKGVVLIRLERYDDAIKQYDKILEIDTENKDALHNKGVVLIRLERYDDAIKQYDKILEIVSKKALSSLTLKDFLNNDFSNISYSDRISYKSPDTIIALHNKCVALHYLERYDDAIKCYNEVINRSNISYDEYFFYDDNQRSDYPDFHIEALNNKDIVSEIQKIINKKINGPYYEKNGIGIEYPDSWMKNENVSKFNLVTFSPILNSYSASLAVNKQKIIENISDINPTEILGSARISGVTKQIENKPIENISDINPTEILDVYSFALIKYIDEKFEITTINNTKISGIPAYEISFNNNGTTVSLLWTLKDNYIYSIIFAVNNKDESSLSTIKKMINSFIINDTINEPSFYIKTLKR